MSAPVQPGEVLAGKYKVERVLGVGGMGVVVAATHLHLDQRVALKFLLPEVVKIPEIVARFQREARAAVKIQSEHVARVIDVGTLESGAPYMVMEYLEGSDLSEVVKQRGPVPFESAIEYVLQACEALAEAHVAGIVHRDLKPANLFLIKRADGSPSVKVLDFGISKATIQAPGQGPLTQTSAVMGSPKYMSPEQLKSSRDVDARSDIWALGIVLHELLTGECAFVSKTLPELLVEILQSAPQTLRSRRPELPPGLEAIILRCLEKDPTKRYGSVAELSLALGEFAPQRARVSIERVTKIVTAAGGPAAVAATNAALSMSASSGQPNAAAQPPPGQPAKTVSATQPAVVSYPGQPSGAWRPDATAPAHAQPGYPPQPGPGGTTPSGYPPFQGMPGPPPGYGSPQRGGAYGPSLAAAPPVQPPQHQAAPRQGMHPALIVMLTLAAVFAFGFGGCMLCVCASAAGGSRSEPGPDVGEAASRPDLTALHPDVLASATWIEGDLTSCERGSPGGTAPFQRPPGWTTVLPGARSRGMASSGRDAALPTSGRDAAVPTSGEGAAPPAVGRDAAIPTFGQDPAPPASPLYRRRRGRRRRKITSGL
jgi:eukaryotic-like serine/threonine-protein kinase